MLAMDGPDQLLARLVERVESRYYGKYRGIVTDNQVTLDSNGIVLEDANGNSVTLDSSGITIKGNQISVGDQASDNLVAFSLLNAALTQFATMVQSHVHVGNLGAPTGPPTPPPTLTLDSAKSRHALEV